MPTKIEWCEETWSPVTGCTPVSEGCRNCFACRMAQRLRGRCGYPKDDPFAVTCHLDRLDKPLHWRKPRRVFVCSMGDLFHKDVHFEFILRVFKRMVFAKQHTYMVLTKRPERMRRFLELWQDWQRLLVPNVWIGVSVENQKTLDDRVRHLLLTPAAKHFISYEPALGPLDCEATSSGQILGECDECGHRGSNPDCEACDGMASIDWVICGGESGAGARPMDPDWARSMRDQCVEARVPFLFKQWGAWAACGPLRKNASFAGGMCYDSASGGTSAGAYLNGSHATMMDGDQIMERVGKKHAGRLLDGREWNEYPEVK